MTHDPGSTCKNTDTAVLSAQGLRKTYGGRAVVDGVCITVQPREIVGLLGPNGAGKTTSFYMIAGLIPAEDGTVHLNGEDISKLPMHRRARLGLLRLVLLGASNIRQHSPAAFASSFPWAASYGAGRGGVRSSERRTLAAG